MTRKDCELLLSRLINRGKADEVFVLLRGTSGTTLRFANNAALPPLRVDDISAQISVRHGGRYATVQCAAFDDATIDAAYERARRIAMEMPDADIVPFPEARLVLEAPIFTQHDSDIDSAWRRSAVERIVSAAKREALVATGSVSSSDSLLALASSHGLFLYQASSLLLLDTRVYSADGLRTAAGRLARRSPSEIDTASYVEEIIARCKRWSNPVEIKPERLTTVFTAQATAELLHPLIQQFSQRAIDENRSFLRRLDGTSFVGATMFKEEVTLSSDPFSTVLPSLPFTAEGTEIKATHWVRKGVIESIALDRFDVKNSDREAVALPSNLLMRGGEQSLDELIANTPRGLLVHGFASLATLDPKNCLLGGSTRDGVFLIEDGVVTKPVRNLYLRETPVYMLKELLALGRPEEVTPTAMYFPMLVPPMRVKDVMYTQLSGVV